MTLDHLWAGWRMAYVSAVSGEGAEAPVAGALGEGTCVFCAVLASSASDEERLVVWEDARVVAVLNAFPYACGHVMVMPRRHVGELEELEEEEASHLWRGVHRAVAALKSAYHPDGCNLGVNLGRAAGAGMPEHLHVHAVPRWVGDTNFMTATASVRVLPEALGETWRKLREAFA